MSIIEVKFATPHPVADAKRRIVAAVTRLVADILRRNPAICALMVENIAADDWFTGGRPLSETGKAAFWLEIRVTDGSVSKDDMARFIGATFAAMAELLGPLHEESYVHVFPVRADSCGYGGRTQEYRFVTARLDKPAG